MAIDIEHVARALHEARCISYGDVKLTSQIVAPVYFNLRKLQSCPEQKSVIADAYTEIIRGLEFDSIAGIPVGAIVLASSVCDRLQVPQITPRMHTKGHGLDEPVDGEFEKGNTTLLLDDVITTGGSLVKAAAFLRDNAGLNITDAVVLLDHQKGGRKKLEEAGIRLHPVFKTEDILRFNLRYGLGNEPDISKALKYLNPSP